MITTAPVRKGDEVFNASFLFYERIHQEQGPRKEKDYGADPSTDLVEGYYGVGVDTGREARARSRVMERRSGLGD